MRNYTDYQLLVIRSLSDEKKTNAKKEEQFCTLTGAILK